MIGRSVHPIPIPQPLKLTRRGVLHVGQRQHLQAAARPELREELLALAPPFHILGAQRPHAALQLPVELPGVLAGQRRAHQL